MKKNNDFKKTITLINENKFQFLISIIIGVIFYIFFSDLIIKKNEKFVTSADVALVDNFINPTSILYESSKIFSHKIKISSKAAKIFTDPTKNEVLLTNKNEICKDLKVEFSHSFHINIEVIGRDRKEVQKCFDFIGNYFIQSLEKVREKHLKENYELIDYYQNSIQLSENENVKLFLYQNIIGIEKSIKPLQNFEPTFILIEQKKLPSRNNIFKLFLLFSFISLFLVLNLMFLYFFKLKK